MEETLKNYEISYDNEGYCKAFQLGDFETYQGQDDVTKNPIAFFKHFGFLVVENVLSGEECDKTVSEVFDIIESKSTFKRDNIETWSDFPSLDSIPQYGSPSKPPIFKTQFLNNRTNPNVFKVFSKVLGNEDLLTNIDRCCFFRPTKGIQIGGQTVDRKEWGTKSNLHLDMNPWAWMGNGDECRNALNSLDYSHQSHFIVENNQPCQADGIQLQGVLNLLDNKIDDGGYVVVPGFNHVFQDYFTNYKKSPFKGGPIDTKANPSYNFSAKELAYPFAKRISMKKGSIVVWDQKMPHGSFGNQSNRPRCAQFLKLFPTNTVSETRYKARAKVVRHNITYNVKPAPFPLNPLSTKLLGLK